MPVPIYSTCTFCKYSTILPHIQTHKVLPWGELLGNFLKPLRIIQNDTLLVYHNKFLIV